MRLRLPLKPGTLFALLNFVSLKVWASEPAGGEHGLDSVVLLEIAVVWVVAKTFGEVFERLGQPSVLGELLGGIVLGNLALFGVTSLEHLKTDALIGALASIGVFILLFEVGLESTVREMLDVGRTALLVAI